MALLVFVGAGDVELFLGGLHVERVGAGEIAGVAADECGGKTRGGDDGDCGVTVFVGAESEHKGGDAVGGAKDEASMSGRALTCMIVGIGFDES